MVAGPTPPTALPWYGAGRPDPLLYSENQYGPAGDGGKTTTRGLFEGKFARYTFDNVYRYAYEESLWQHGGVKVTYKERLSYEKGENDAEYSPVIARERPPVGGIGPPVTVSVS
jgi:hypothetical protein